MQIPSFLLKKLYVKGSLENVDDGFHFKLKNSLSPGTAIGMEPIKVNGQEYSLADTTISTEGSSMVAADVNGDQAFAIKVGVDIVIHIKGTPLAEGDHKIDISLTTKEAGKLAFDVSDSI
ncbi:MAG: hydroxymethylglutaryl-CoA reductase [Candidatus Thorarchaeota archaeon]